MALKQPSNEASKLLAATITEINTAVANAKNRLTGIPSDGAAPVATAQQVQEEADATTWATLQVIQLAANCDDAAALAAAIVALTPKATATNAATATNTPAK